MASITSIRYFMRCGCSARHYPWVRLNVAGMKPQSGLEEENNLSEFPDKAQLRKTRNKNQHFKAENKERRDRKRRDKKLKKLARAALKTSSGLLSTQSGWSDFIISDALQRRGFRMDTTTASFLENTALALFAMSQQETISGLLATMLLYFKTAYGPSIGSVAIQSLVSICGAKYTEIVGALGVQSSAFSEVGDERPEWLVRMKEVSSNWSLLSANAGLEKIGQILAMLVSLGLCQLGDIVPSVNGVALFALPAAKRTITALTLIDAIIDIVMYFVEGGYLCYKEGSPAPLLFGNTDVRRYTEDYLLCLKCSALMASGNLLNVDMDDNKYDKLLHDTVTHARALCKSAPSPMEKSVYMRQIESLTRWQADFSEKRMTGEMRMAPYAIGLFGPTGVGKSSLTNIFMDYVLRANGFPHSKEYIISINEADQYMSGYKSYITGVVLDDIGNTSPNYVKVAPTERMIQLINNVQVTANMADVESKGKVSLQPKVVIATKNVKDANACVYSMEPASICRRENVIITVDVKDEFKSHGMLDPTKVSRHYGDVDPGIPDLWELSVERAIPVKGPPGTRDGVGYKICNHRRPLDAASIAEVLAFLRDDSTQHFENQRKLIDRANASQELPICATCSLPCCLHGCTEDECRDVPVVPVPSTDFLYPQNGPQQWLDDAQRAVPRDSWWNRASNWLTSRKTNALRSLRGNAIIPMTLGVHVLTRLDSLLYGRLTKYVPLLFGFLHRVEKASTKTLVTRLERLEKSVWCDWLAWLPTGVQQSDLFKEFYVELRNTEEADKPLWNQYLRIGHGMAWSLVFWIAGLRLMWFVPYRSIWAFGTTLVTAHFSNSMCTHTRHMMYVGTLEKSAILAELTTRHDAASVMQKVLRDSRIAWICGASAAIGIIYGMCLVYRNTSNSMQVQGNLMPENEEDVKKRDSELNPWLQVQIEPIIASEASRTTTHAQLVEKVTHNLTYMSYVQEDRILTCNALFLGGNLVLLPNHIFNVSDLVCTFHRDRRWVGGSVTASISKQQSVQLPGTDLRLVWAPGCGDWRDLTAYLPESLWASQPGCLVYRTKAGEILSSKLMAKRDKVCTNEVGSYDGATYDLEWDTFPGLCMATIISDTRTPQLLGFHLSGKGRKGGLGLMTLSSFEAAKNALRSMPGVLIAKNLVNPEKEILGVQFSKGNEIHKKSAVRYLEKGSVRVHGPVIGMSNAYSVVHPSPISDLVAEEFGVPQQWGPPAFRTTYPYQASLVYSANPSFGIEGDLLERAVVSYSSRLFGLLDQHEFLSAAPLDEISIVSGVDDLRFVDALKSSTSMGYPLSGPKSNFLVELEASDTHACPKTFPKQFWDELARVEAAYIGGNRTTQIFKACLKDEPTKIGKDKVRVFQAAPIVLQLGVRKYFLPLARILSLFPTVSECAVGVNAESPEWEQLDAYMTFYGENRVFAGDYGKYDLRMPAQLILAAFRILIDFARKLEYSDRDLSVMEGFASEIAYSYTAYNGDLLGFIGSNPSGHNLTVYINSIVNSLLVRSGFFFVYPKADFNTAVHIVTYGDDVKGSVHMKYPMFHHISYAQFLANRDMVFTMPDKTATPTEYMSNSECDFLKRLTYYHEDLECKVGILADSSIYKSLHCQMRSSYATEEQIAAQNLEGALRAWFYHGKHIFEAKKEKLRNVALKADLLHMCPFLSREYEDIVLEWRARWKP